eukprot:CAMPEP_0180663902 /NCGR_PEP_ID=MMETSP1037_2-20121125/60271_1 /TAXON_ID=632150 /ORGANISM="Azadinium spinosum, Strain 3D9" /LENGTH=63 /DNA_ID=CAMNT_0022691859 /DNA_START=200 /DNA_END=391 /DNA_ORIENTATION=-
MDVARVPAQQSPEVLEEASEALLSLRATILKQRCGNHAQGRPMLPGHQASVRAELLRHDPLTF